MLVELENMFFGQGILWEQVWSAIHDMQDQTLTTQRKRCQENPACQDGRLQDRTRNFRNLVSNSKRQRCESDVLSLSSLSHQSQHALQQADEDPYLPPATVM